MKNKGWNVRMLWGMVILWGLLCFYLSSQKLTSTTQLSDTITHVILRVFHLPGQTYYMAIFNEVRLAAHVLIFAVLSMLLCGALLVTGQKKRRCYFLSFAVGAVCSVGSEVGKLFVTGRHCSIADMILNLLGCVLGIGLIYILKKQR